MSTAVIFPETGEDAIIRNLKRPALLFETIQILHLNGLTVFLDQLKSEDSLQLRAELLWLLDRSIIAAADFGGFTDNLVDHFEEVSKSSDHFNPWFGDGRHLTDFQRYRYASQMTDLQLGILRVSPLSDAGAVVVCARMPDHLHFVEQTLPVTSQADVMSVVLRAFPEPPRDTPWEQIIEFRQHPDTSAALLLFDDGCRRFPGKT